MKLKEIDAESRPREKLISRGPEALSNGELLAILLHSGIPGTSVVELSEKLLSLGGGTLKGLFSLGTERMCGLPGVGRAKAAQVQAALELGRRFLYEQSNVRARPIVGPRMVYDRVIPFLKGLDHEQCWILLLNKSNYLVEQRRLTTGGSDSTVIDIKRVVRLALDRNASAIVLVHNHPSGNPRPSRADIDYTDKLHSAASSMDIALLDHVVVCDSVFYSFADDKLYDAGVP
ncbi:MAG: DNA repair protein RadC [Bacteroidales bacterium]|nr:DNA repair protein RadC [Bacteroidales bacterium]